MKIKIEENEKLVKSLQILREEMRNKYSTKARQYFLKLVEKKR